MRNKPNRKARVAPPLRQRVRFWLQLLTWALLGATLAGRMGSSFFLFELCSHFAVQYALVAGLLMVFWLYKGPHLLGLMAALTLLVNGLLVMPWLSTPKPPSNTAYDLRVLHANVLFSSDDYAHITHLVLSQSPDFFILQEMTPESIRGVASLTKTYPYQYNLLAKGPCYILVGSRTPFSVDTAAARALRVVSLQTTVRGHHMALLTVHPQTPLLPGWLAGRNEQLEFVAEKARRQELPTVVAGDFNISVFSPTYQAIFEQPRLTACRRGFGLQPTWPRFFPPMFIPIDHAFVNPGFRTVRFQTLDQGYSDHKAVVVDLALTGQTARR